MKARTIDEYIDAAPERASQRLRELLQCLREAAPGADETIKWSKPALSYQTILFVFAAYKNHLSLYPTPPVIKAFKKQLAGYKTSSATVQFPLEEPLPLDLIRVTSSTYRQSLTIVGWWAMNHTSPCTSWVHGNMPNNPANGAADGQCQHIRLFRIRKPR